MVAPAVSEITWVAIDPGDSRLSPAHIEEVIRTKASSLGISLNWLATNPIGSGDARYGFLMSADEDLTRLKEQILTDLQAAPSLHESDIATAITRGERGRFIIFPSEIKEFAKHSSSEITSMSAIEEVLAVGEELPSDAVIETHGYVRPVLHDGKITLLVERQYTGEFSPIEKANPHECCGGAHAPH
jgi:hypothetical protein